MNVCEVISLTKHYKKGSIAVLNQLSLTIKRGESVAIMGESGSGKSTLLHLLGCLDTPDSGSYLLDGESVFALTDHERSKVRSRKVGFVFQAFNLIPEMTVRENVRLPLLYRGESINEEEIEEAIASVSLFHRKEHLPLELSGGEMQRVAIARALLQKPSLLLADEPTGNLDRKTADHILHHFSLLKERGCAIVLVTHDSYTASFADRLLHLQEGALV